MKKTIVVLLVLSLFSLRRFIFLLTAIFCKRDWNLNVVNESFPSVTVYIPCHNEETVIGATLDSLLQINYPPDNDFSQQCRMKNATDV